MSNNQDVRSAVRSILENSVASGSHIPSIRAIRAMIGKGSLGTISEEVNTWRQEQLKAAGSLPSGFKESETKQIAEAVWGIVQPILRRQIEAVEKKADARVTIERNEAAKIREAADDVLTTAEEKDKLIMDLTDKIKEYEQKNAKLQGANDELRQENERLREEVAEFSQKATQAITALESMKKFLPLLDPKHLNKLGSSSQQE